MLDLFAKVSVWIAGATLIVATLVILNEIPPKMSCFWTHVRKFVLLVVFAGSACLVLSPMFGWVLSVYGGHLVAVGVAIWVMCCFIRARVFGTRHALSDILEMREVRSETQHH